MTTVAKALMEKSDYVQRWMFEIHRLKHAELTLIKKMKMEAAVARLNRVCQTIEKTPFSVQDR